MVQQGCWQEGPVVEGGGRGVGGSKVGPGSWAMAVVELRTGGVGGWCLLSREVICFCMCTVWAAREKQRRARREE